MTHVRCLDVQLAGVERVTEVMATATTGRSWAQTLTSGILALNGVTTILYASILPLPLLGYAGAPVWALIGAISLVAAVGVFRRRSWGRLTGVVLLAGALVYAVMANAEAFADPNWPLVLFLLGQAPTAFGMWALLRRWRGSA